MPIWNLIRPLLLPDFTTKQAPFSLGHWDGERPEPQPKSVQADQLPKAYQGDLRDETLSADLAQNLARAKASFSLPHNQGLNIHKITLPTTPPREAAVLFILGMVDPKKLSLSVLAPLLDHAGSTEPRTLLRRVLDEGQGQLRRYWADVVNDLLNGSAVILVDKETQAVSISIEGWPKRQINVPRAEVTVRGPQESFTEDLHTNLTQLRRRLRTPDLSVESAHLGTISRSEVAIIYLKGVTNPRLVGEVRRRIAAVKVDYVADCAGLLTFIEDHPYSLFPTVVTTERPDRVASMINEGFVVVIVDNDPHALILPTTLPALIHSSEDYYLAWGVGTFLRLIRVAAYYISLLLPGIYIALINFRQEMIPTPLLIAIEHSRQTVPISVVLEVLLMEGSFQLVNEASVRIPTAIGPTIGIVGSLILGQAAVSAGVVSPILVIITSATALATFAIPSYELQMATRIWRFGYIAVAAVTGLAGLIMLHIGFVAYLASMNSFGAPYLAPITPYGRPGDSIFRAPLFTTEKRPSLVRAQRSREQKSTRAWAPEMKPSRREGADDRT